MLPVLTAPHRCPGHQLHHPERPRGARQQHHQLHRHQRCQASRECPLLKSEALPNKEFWGVPCPADHGQPGFDGGERAGVLGGSDLPLPPHRALAPPLPHLRPLCNFTSFLHDGAFTGRISSFANNASSIIEGKCMCPISNHYESKILS